MIHKSSRYPLINKSYYILLQRANEIVYFVDYLTI